ncbi:MAG TPA: D-alanyl-D-alanine carboxypeptidase [Ktedonobacteraceae bacterium]|jgi:D-alanyl-D-alanine carboxypeptidase (penicillin-binding protein 5/6)|nr:D-alanyl-D-alanine carboxypeptidase [Ktedonobacteraceae bacterium]
MERHALLGIICIIIAVLLLIAAPLLAFTPPGNRLLAGQPPFPTPTPIPPTPTPQPVLTPRGTPPTVSASEYYLIDMNTHNVLADKNAVESRPMASTTKIMTALIAIQSGDLTLPVTVHQDALERIAEGGSSANLRLGDTIPLGDMLYGMMLPSGDDAAWAIADALAGNEQNFVQRMNLFAYHLRLFQTHYASPDGLSLTSEEDAEHYTSANDLARLTTYALSIPFFAKIVHTDHYAIPATATHAAYSWTNTNTLLVSYPGMLGVKTGFTYAAGYCLVFAAQRNGHELLGVVMNSSSEDLRNKDAVALLNWGFALPLLPPKP